MHFISSRPHFIVSVNITQSQIFNYVKSNHITQSQILSTVVKMATKDVVKDEVAAETNDKEKLEEVIHMLKGLTPQEKKDIVKELQVDDSEPTNSAENGGSPKLPRFSTPAGTLRNVSTPTRGRGIQSLRGAMLPFPRLPIPVQGAAVNPNRGINTPRGTSHPPRLNLHSPPLLHQNTETNSERFYFQTPRLPTFSGDIRSEVAYRQWRAEVKGLEADKGIASQSLLQLVRRSVKGMAAQCLLQLGEGCDVTDVITHFDVIFGDVLTSEQVMAKFYVSAQDTKETAAAWGCRLREILSCCPEVEYRFGPQAEAMMRQKFWSGLRSEKVKTATRHLYDRGDSFNNLLVAARRVEQEEGLGQPKANAHQLTGTPLEQADKLDRILDKLKELETKVSRLEKANARERAKEHDKVQVEDQRGAKPMIKGVCYNCGKPGHIAKYCRNDSLNREGPTTRGSRGSRTRNPNHNHQAY